MVSQYHQLMAGRFRVIVASLLATSIHGVMMKDSSASDLLDPMAAVKVEYTISEWLGNNTVSASVTFSADGLRKWPADGAVSVNGHVLPAKRLAKQGWWYQDHIPVADRYDLLVQRGSGASPLRFVLRSRPFSPQLPATLSRHAPPQIPFEGAAPSANERIYIELSSVASAAPLERWQIIVYGAAHNGTIVIPESQAMALTQAPLGEARLYVGLLSQQCSPGTPDDLTYSVGRHVVVRITE